LAAIEVEWAKNKKLLVKSVGEKMGTVFIRALLISVLILQPGLVMGEAVDDKFTQISPKHVPGNGEYVHGQGYGKLLIRVMVFGAVPQQGVHYVPEGTDLVFGLIYSGGYGENTKLSDITIRRKGVAELIQIDLEDLLEEGKPIPKLQDGDIVNVPFNWRKDFQDFLMLTQMLTSVTGFVLSIVALSQIRSAR
jgi:hypothetical protein